MYLKVVISYFMSVTPYWYFASFASQCFCCLCLYLCLNVTFCASVASHEQWRMWEAGLRHHGPQPRSCLGIVGVARRPQEALLRPPAAQTCNRCLTYSTCCTLVSAAQTCNRCYSTCCTFLSVLVNMPLANLLMDDLVFGTLAVNSEEEVRFCMSPKMHLVILHWIFFVSFACQERVHIL